MHIDRRQAPRRRHHTAFGFTISEVLVANSVLAVLLMLALAAIVPSWRVTRQAEAELAAQRGVARFFDRLVTELSPLDRATAVAGPGAFSFLSDRSYVGSAPPVGNELLVDLGVDSLGREWRTIVVLAHDEGALWRLEYPYFGGSRLAHIDPEALENLASGAADSPARVGIAVPAVDLFECRLAGRSRVFFQIRSRIEDTDKAVSFQSNLQVQMRSGR